MIVAHRRHPSVIPDERFIGTRSETLLPQQRDPAVQPIQRQRKHPRPDEIEHDLCRAGVAPRGFRLGIEPDGVAIRVDKALKPSGARLVIQVLDAAAGLQQFVRAHRRVPNDNQSPVRPVLVQDVEGPNALVAAAAVVAPDVIVDAVVKVEIFEMPEFALGRRKELLADADVWLHRPTNVEEKEHFDTVAPLGDQMQIEPTGVLRRAFDGRVEIELFGDAFACEAAQTAQRDFDVAGVELDRIIEVAKAPFVPNFDRGAVASAFLPEANAFRVVAVGAERTGAGGANPFLAALVALTLLLEPGFERLHELLPTAE